MQHKQYSLGLLFFLGWTLINILMVPFVLSTPEKSVLVQQQNNHITGFFGSIQTHDSPFHEPRQPVFWPFVLLSIIFLCSVLFMPSRKSQLTIFIILGFVIIFIFSFIIYVKMAVLDNIEEQQPIAASFEISSFKAFVQNCLDAALIEGLDLAGKQGGRIYDYQGGL